MFYRASLLTRSTVSTISCLGTSQQHPPMNTSSPPSTSPSSRRFSPDAYVIQRPGVGEEGEGGGLARATGVRDPAVVSERAGGTDVYTTSGEIAVNQTTTGVGDRADVG